LLKRNSKLEKAPLNVTDDRAGGCEICPNEPLIDTKLPGKAIGLPVALNIRTALTTTPIKSASLHHTRN
jgi:hypothetical protein